MKSKKKIFFKYLRSHSHSTQVVDELKLGDFRQETILDTLTVIQIKYRLDQV